MINNLQISGVRVRITDDLKTYIKKKIGGLDKYIPKKARESTFVEVKLKDTKAKNKVCFQCEVIMKLPRGNVTAHEDGSTEKEAIDKVEDNLKIQLKKYKDLHSGSRLRRHLLSRIKRKAAVQNIF